jgi:hypothetical protein
LINEQDTFFFTLLSTDVMAGLLDIITDGDYSLVLNGASKHLNTDYDYNERNPGLGLLAEKDGKFLTVGGYKNSHDDNSFYVGGGLKKRFGSDYYIEPGIFGGAFTGYEPSIMPAILPMLSVGKKGGGALNTMYSPKIKDKPAVLMFNLSVPFK